MQNEASFLLRNGAKKLLTITQAAEFLKISSDTLRRWEEKGIVTPQRTKGGSRRYTLLDLKIAKLNKRKIRFFQLPSLLKQNYLSSKRDIRVALLTSFLWIFGLLIYHFLITALSMPTSPERQVLSDQLKQPGNLKMASITTPIKATATNVVITDEKAPLVEKTNPEVSLSSDLLIDKFIDSETLRYTDTLNQYYLLQPLPQNDIPTLIKRI